jgi:DNA-binding transcriptional LysR family regulator
MQHLDIDDLALLVTVANRASFSAAARELGRTQAAVSFAVARLEQRVQARLFERTPRGAAPTPTGETLLAYARRILALEDEALTTLRGGASTQRVRLGLPDDYMDCLGTQALAAFTAAWPAVPVEILCDFSRRLEILVGAGDLDLAVVTRDRQAHAGEKLRDEPQVWCAARERRPETERVLPVALFNEQCRARPTILATLERWHRPWRLAYSCSHLHGIYAAVERGGAVAVLPASCVPPHLRVLGPEAELPPLPSLELALLLPEGAGVMSRRLAQTLRECFALPSAPAASVEAAA